MACTCYGVKFCENNIGSQILFDGKCGGSVVECGARGRRFETYLRRVVSLSTLLPESTGKTQEAVAPSRHD